MHLTVIKYYLSNYTTRKHTNKYVYGDGHVTRAGNIYTVAKSTTRIHAKPPTVSVSESPTSYNIPIYNCHIIVHRNNRFHIYIKKVYI